ncbi:MAG: DUF58 domain-containing protein [Solirubrobacterales bacterium]
MRGPGALLLGLGLSGAALIFGITALWMPGLMLITVAVAAAVWTVTAAVSTTVWREAPEELVEGAEQPIWAHARSEGLGAIVELDDPVAAGTTDLATRSERGTTTSGGVMRAGRRGRRVLPAVRARVGDPLGLWGRVRLGGEQQVLIVPRVDPVDPAVLRAAGVVAPRGAVDGPEADLHALEPARPGTAASRIHWPALARGAGLVERRYAAPADQRGPLIVVSAPAGSQPEALDRAVRAAGSVSCHLRARGGCRLLVPGEPAPRVIDGDHSWAEARRLLAVVMAGPLALDSRSAVSVWIEAGPAGPPVTARAARLVLWADPAMADDDAPAVAGLPLRRMAGRSAA